VVLACFVSLVVADCFSDPSGYSNCLNTQVSSTCAYFANAVICDFSFDCSLNAVACEAYLATNTTCQLVCSSDSALSTPMPLLITILFTAVLFAIGFR